MCCSATAFVPRFSGLRARASKSLESFFFPTQNPNRPLGAIPFRIAAVLPLGVGAGPVSTSYDVVLAWWGRLTSKTTFRGL